LIPVAHAAVFLGTFQIGRDESGELQLDDPLISRRHAEVRFEHGRWWLVDLQSRNGTRLDGQLIECAPLPTTCSVKLHEAASALILDVRGPSLAALTVTSGSGLRPAD
jgi:hypothetical protein